MKVVALCSCPRLGYMDMMGVSIVAFAKNNVDYKNLYGVYWSQCLSNGLQDAMEEGYDYAIVCDYDSLFDHEDVAQLIRLAEQNPQADAICAMQMGRFSGLLISTESGTITLKELRENPLVPVKTGHFGLTIIRISALRQLDKPWFHEEPDYNNEWRDKITKTDSDVWFWENFDASGCDLYLAPRIVIGHIETLIKYPDDRLDGTYSTMENFRQFGKPGNVWR